MLAILSLGDYIPYLKLYSRSCILICMMALLQMSAAAFAKGLLDLEGQLTPILVSRTN